jgi:hypothetical protein
MKVLTALHKVILSMYVILLWCQQCK